MCNKSTNKMNIYDVPTDPTCNFGSCAQCLAFRPNFMIFDEPTNHLDMESIEALAKCLDVSNFKVIVQRYLPITFGKTNDIINAFKRSSVVKFDALNWLN